MLVEICFFNISSQIRKENIDFNNNRVNEANSNSELWKITKEVTNTRKKSKWDLNVEGKKSTKNLNQERLSIITLSRK